MSRDELKLNLKVKVTSQERMVLEGTMSNWDNLHTSLSAAIERGEVGEVELLKMLKVEATGKKRMLICTRLLAVYHRLVKASFERQLAVALAK